ncbi:tRNA (adenosine(37)-N6)-threonylcarbamoyltransferase complex ATPase subunit type 1 TsaE [Patescibacteria group bacterium]|nr:tRNA (adenosine(37)-N6)-threonylcarbamoyltransferase complex ATPase subunit type 1 TsaE [Patescibacteria group bacterium]
MIILLIIMDIYKNLSLTDINNLAIDTARSLSGSEVICLYGDLGAGKTTFTKALGRALGINKDILSPTFVIRSDYRGKEFDIYHFDWYRIDDSKELFDIGFFDVLYNGVVIIEWADKCSDVIEHLKRVDIYIETISKNRRLVKINNGYIN